MTGTIDEFNSIKIPGAEALGIISPEKAPSGVSAEKDVGISQQEHAKLEKRKKERNGVFNEWLFVYVPKHIEENARLVRELEYVKNNLKLTAADQVIFKKSIEALRALHAFELDHFNARKFSEESLNKSEEEQVEIISDLYNENYIKKLNEKFIPFFILSSHLDEIFVTHRGELDVSCPLFVVLLSEKESLSEADKKEARREQTPILIKRANQFSMYGCKNGVWQEIELSDLDQDEQNYLTNENKVNFKEKRKNVNNRTIMKTLARGHTLQPMQDKQKFDFLSKEVSFMLQPRLMQELTRTVFFATNLFYWLEPLSKEKFQNLYTNLSQMSLDINKLKSINSLCHENGIKHIDVNRDDFLQAEKAERFLSFLGNDKQKIAYFKLLQKLHTQGPEALQENSRKRIFPAGAGHSTIDEIKNLFPFFEPSINELLKTGKGKEDEPETKENIALAFSTIQSLLLNVLEADFAVFTKKREHTIPQKNDDIELEAIAVNPDKSQYNAVNHLNRPQLAKTASLEKLSTMLGEAAKAVATKLKSAFSNHKNGPFSGPRADLCAEIPFFEFVQTLKYQVDVFTDLAADPKHKDDIRLPGWKFSVTEDLSTAQLPLDVNIRTVEEKNDPDKTSNKKFRGELSQHDTIVAVVTGQKLEDQSSLFTGAEFYGKPENYQIDFVVRAMVDSLAKIGQKEICISVRPDSPDAEALALHYAGTILKCGAIPILLGDDGVELTTEGTKDKLRAMLANNPQLDENYMVLLERYESEVERVDNARSEDKQFLLAFESFMGRLVLNGKTKMPCPRDPNKGLSKKEIIFRLAEIALVNHNMTTEQFVDAIVTYMARISLSPFASRTEVKKDLETRLNILLMTQPKDLAADIFREAAAAFYPTDRSLNSDETSLLLMKQKTEKDLFLIEFNKLLQELQFFSSHDSAKSVTMDVSNFSPAIQGKAVWGEARILEELAKIALIDKQIDRDIFVDKIVNLAWASSKHDSGTVLSQPSRDRLKNILLGRIKVFSVADGVEPAAKLACSLIELARGELESGALTIVEDNRSDPTQVQQVQKELSLSLELGSKADDVIVDIEPKIAQEEQLSKDRIGIPQLQDGGLSDSGSLGNDSLDDYFIKESVPEQEQAEMQDAQILKLQIDAAWIDSQLLKMEMQQTEELYGEIDTVLAEEKTGVPHIEVLEIEMYPASVGSELQEGCVQEIIEAKEPRLSLAQKELAQRITILYDRRNQIGPDWRFARALAVYALFLGEIRHENFDLADALLPEISYIIADAEQILELDKSKYGAVDRQDTKNKYEALLRNISAALRLELQSGKAYDNSLESVGVQMLTQDLKERHELKEMLTELEEISSENQADKEAVQLVESSLTGGSEPREVSEMSASEELDDLLRALNDEIISTYSDNSPDRNADKKETSQSAFIQPKCFSILGPKCHVNKVPAKESAYSPAIDKQDAHKGIKQEAKPNAKENSHPFSGQAKWFGIFGQKYPGARNQKPTEAETKLPVSSPAPRGR